MKLIRYGEPGKEKPGVVIDEKKYSITCFAGDFDEIFFGGDGLQRLADFIASNKDSLQPLADDVRLGAPLLRPSKIVCVGLNFADHAKESGATIPKEPIIFFKSTSAIIGPNDDVMIPRNSKKTDWKVELAIVIGKKASYVSEENALDHVAGYVLHNDYSEREFQLERGGQWVKGKSCDTFAPIGPFIATQDEIADINNLPMWLKVNGKTFQDGTTSSLIFKIPFLVSYISQFMSLLSLTISIPQLKLQVLLPLYQALGRKR
ncbi:MULTISPECIES: fumarylacetoacetate hydrolase family protein [unclassified Mucilaginibacter]|uniref:fumarylacetoacetate hydrolase family protein n=1 Tax=unclassified Mucilaginibacter TaxID=2617802 RepID=UPI002AC98A1A|nr:MULTISPECIES: fumarylacetoacetate hydrolase family protein [unclassified Mucilaginibacter]MEB0261962.1 fumarylacetoacetate hydrolase family protein [Mucilaginibacter sp. 10I4]MEB0277262.1 fumarylacetoacetate hydrolase family protein [Mucilaginibacter sp. 10B2]MEB0300874.1 fumarylacetoacetate hydrolase family protein [Mucilaginibacter sp. 5C4]WPX25389.1 fumarylacetoacetate hydrolase family protein [Mucilaginibacter sp. 5C4]